MEQAHREGVWGLLLFRFPGSESIGKTDAERHAAESHLRGIHANHLRLRHACGQVLKALQRAGVPVLCMRGVAVSERYYGELAPLRPISDIDLLLDGTRMLDAKQALWDIGFRPSAAYRSVYLRGDITLDLHDEPISIERVESRQHITPLRAPDFFAHTRDGALAGVDAALLLDVSLELPYLALHAMKHSFERLIWLYDIALVAKRVDEEGAWEQVDQAVRTYRLQRPCYYALAYAREHLGAPVPYALLESMRPSMGFVERNLFRRYMQHRTIPYLGERLMARMQPDFRHRVAFWRETIYPRYEVRKQMAHGGCVKCSFIRKRLKQLLKALWSLIREGFTLFRA